MGLSLPEFTFPLHILKPSNDIFWSTINVLNVVSYTALQKPSCCNPVQFTPLLDTQRQC